MNVIEILSTFSEPLLQFIIVGCLFSKQQNTIKRTAEIFVCAIVVAVVIYIENVKGLNPYITMLTALFLTSVISYTLYKADFKSLLAVNAVYILFVALLDFILFFILSLFVQGTNFAYELLTTGNTFRSVYIIIAKVILIICCCVFLSFKPKLDHMKYSMLIVIMSILLYIIQKYCIDALISSDMEQLKFCVGISCTMSILVSISILMYLRIKVRAKEQENHFDLISLRNEITIENIKRTNDSLREIARAHHDYNNQLKTIYSLLDDGKYEKAKTFISNIENAAYNSTFEVNTKYDIVNAVLNCKINEAKKQNIKIHYDIELPEELMILENDLCTVLYNLLDNSIEACLKINDIQERYINLKVKSINNLLFIIINNPISKCEETTKNVGHGYGQINIQHIAEKYNGMFEKAVIDNEYCVKIYLTGSP